MKVKHLTVSSCSLASTITCKKVRNFLEKHKLSDIVIEHPSLLSKEEFEELASLVNFEVKEKEIKN